MKIIKRGWNGGEEGTARGGGRARWEPGSRWSQCVSSNPCSGVGVSSV